MSTYAPLGWLLREDIGNRAERRTRRVLYRRLVADLAREFNSIYTERLNSSNGPWDFSDVYTASLSARKCVRRMRWCAFQHMLWLPGVSVKAADAYQTVADLLEAGTKVIPAAGPSIS